MVIQINNSIFLSAFDHFYNVKENRRFISKKEGVCDWNVLVLKHSPLMTNALFRPLSKRLPQVISLLIILVRFMLWYCAV